MNVPTQTPELIAALRSTARRVEAGASYRWAHMGSCNCGHLAQTLTRLSKEEIHRLALQKAGDWHHQVREYCPTSGLPMDHIVETMLGHGLQREDLQHLERLSDPRVLRRLPLGERHLDYRKRDDFVLYLRLWADGLEEQWMKGQEVPDCLPGDWRRTSAALPVAGG